MYERQKQIYFSLHSPLAHLFPLVLLSLSPPFPLTHANFYLLCPVFHSSFCHLLCSHPSLTMFLISYTSSHCPSSPHRRLFHASHSSLLIFSPSTLQKRKTTTISVEVKKSQHKYIIGPKGNTLQEILEATGVSVEMPPLDSSSETIILRGEPDKLGPALTQVYAKVRTRGEVRD